MSSFTVVTEQLDDAHGQLARVADELHGWLTALDREVHGVLGVGWSGPAAQTVAHAWADWAHGAGAVIASLQQLVTLLAGSALAYASTEAGVRATVQRAAGGDS